MTTNKIYEDDLTEICCRIVNEMIGADLIIDCTENEFEAQEIIFSILNTYTQSKATSQPHKL